MKIFSPILKGTTTMSQGTTNLSGSFTGSLFGTAATASYADNFTVGGTLTAQTINVQIITSSIEFNTGSTRNGALSSNTHQFTGSVLMSGSLGIGTSSPNTTLEVVGGNNLPPSTGTQNYTLALRDPTSMVAGVGGSILLQGFKTSTSAIGNFAYIVGKKENGTAGNESGFLSFGTFDSSGNPAERMRITSAGNVGIGTSSPTKLITTNQTGSTGYLYSGQLNGTEIAYWYYNANEIQFSSVSGSRSLNFYTTDTERMRITSAGNVGIGTTSPSSKLHVVTTGTSFTPTATGPIGGNINHRVHIQGNEPGLMISSDANGSGSPTGTQTYQLGLQIGVYTTNDIRNQIYFGNTLLSFVYSGDQGANGSERMRISTNGSIGAPNGTNIYNASDVRLKQNISTTTYGLNTISLLNPVKFNWVDGFEPTEDGKDMLGFVAQEVQTIIPEAVESFGGDINLNGTIVTNPLRVNEKFIIPVLVKAIQELKSENDTLKEILQRNNIQ